MSLDEPSYFFIILAKQLLSAIWSNCSELCIFRHNRFMKENKPLKQADRSLKCSTT